VAWRSGIIVVTSAGNSGSSDGRLTNPASDPFVIAVGADDLNGSPSITDDTIPTFSSRGNGTRNPDFVAPGVHVQSLRVPGSYIDATYGATGAIDGRFFRGSGTSQGAAFISGCLALVAQKYPSITPDQAKQLLASTTSPLGAADRQAQGSGLVNMRNVAGKAPVTSTQSFPRSTGTGSLEAARGSAHLALNGVTLSGETDINGLPFNSASMATAEAAGKSWAGGTWNGKSWAGSAWTGSSWDASSWTGTSWDARSWTSASWASGTWSGSSWTSSNWSGKSWAGSSWSGSAWNGKSWADDTWS
jgi:serine protease AprX